MTWNFIQLESINYLYLRNIDSVAFIYTWPGGCRIESCLCRWIFSYLYVLFELNFKYFPIASMLITKKRQYRFIKCLVRFITYKHSLYIHLKVENWILILAKASWRFLWVRWIWNVNILKTMKDEFYIQIYSLHRLCVFILHLQLAALCDIEFSLSIRSEQTTKRHDFPICSIEMPFSVSLQKRWLSTKLSVPHCMPTIVCTF